MKEANELLEIWFEFYDFNKDYRLRENRRRQRLARIYLYKYDSHKVLRFWHLKAKINDLKKQILFFSKYAESLEPMKKAK